MGQRGVNLGTVILPFAQSELFSDSSTDISLLFPEGLSFPQGQGWGCAVYLICISWEPELGAAGSTALVECSPHLSLVSSCTGLGLPILI